MSAQGEKATLNPTPFAVAEETLDGVLVICVSGELDLNTAPQLADRLQRADEGARVLVDLSNCEFIDSTGIGLIVRGWQRLEGDARDDSTTRFALCGLSNQVRRLLEITGLQSSIATYLGRDEALAALRPD